MRITAGELKGRRVSTKPLGVSLKGGTLRPTSSKVREAIFNILGQRIKDAVFVDLYAGTGAVGMEAMSRGAQNVFFIDANKRSGESISSMLSGCGCSGKATILKKKAASFVREAAGEGISADIVFIDPPYYSDELENMLYLLSDGAMLKGDGIILTEHLSKKDLPEQIGMLVKQKTYKYGDTALTLYKAEK